MIDNEVAVSMAETIFDLRERNAKLVAAFMFKLREENECNGPCADNQKCGCRGEMENYIALAAQQSTEKP